MNLKKILEHELVPRHEIMGKNEVEQLLKKYGISKNELPKIKENDPVVEAIHAKKGAVLKITRKSQTAEKAVYYRTVV